MAKLTVQRINEMTDMQILLLSVPRPDAPGHRGFVFTLSDFDSRQEMADCMVALTMRLQKISKQGNTRQRDMVSEKVASRYQPTFSPMTEETKPATPAVSPTAPADAAPATPEVTPTPAASTETVATPAA